ncbi:MAG: hypothetical protein IJS81_09265, partial [Selenomonadaceae bacterium]|nr:hypothetical protein [Selenomonadaceae bacterium]
MSNHFTETSSGTELNPDGSGFRSTKFLTMTNLIANSKMLRQFADIKYADELPHLKRPKLKNGERTIIEIEPTEEFNQFKLELLRRAEAVRRSKKRQKGADNMLAITNDFRAASIDLQLVMPETDESAAGNKIPVLCDVIKKKYDETADVKGTQLVFCDLGVPKGKKKNDGNKSV